MGLIKPFGDPSGFQQLRRWMIWLGTELMDMEFMRSDQVVILPATYNNPTFTFYPETEGEKLYANTLTGIVLSLIEQRDLFEGRTKSPTQAEADSYIRTSPTNTPTVDIRQQNKQIAIYPNPVYGSYLYLNGLDDNEKFKRAEIFNSLGVLVRRFSFESVKDGIPIADLKTGNFFVRLIYSDKVINQTFIVSR